MISNRAYKNIAFPNLLYESWRKYHDNPFHAGDNPGGIVNLGTAENNLMYDALKRKLGQCVMENMDESLTHYCNMIGTEGFRNQLSIFLNHFMKPKTPISPEDIHVLNGCGVAIEALSFVLCDPNDGILIPAPYYKAFDADIGQRFCARTWSVQFSMTNNFKIDINTLEMVFQQAATQGCSIKALIISNPYNPLGIAYDCNDLKVFLEFCFQKNIHFVCDEVYMLSVYDKQMKYINLLAVEDIDKYRNIIHIIWGFSKDFALSGFRCGILITFNELVKKTLKAQAYYTSVSTITQFVLKSFISDLSWIEMFITTNHDRLLQARNFVLERLSVLETPYIVPNSGLFVVFNASKFIAEKSNNGELELFNAFLQNGVYIVPGSHLEFCESGWFRIVIANNQKKLAVGMNRIMKVLKSQKPSEQ